MYTGMALAHNTSNRMSMLGTVHTQREVTIHDREAVSQVRFLVEVYVKSE